MGKLVKLAELTKANKMDWSFETLEVWKEGRKLRIAISEFCKSLPREEEYRLKDQMIRSSRSVTANVSEGFGRYHYQENIQFCRSSRGSLTELLDHCFTALDEGYMNETMFDTFKAKIENVLKLLNGYILYIQKKKAEGK